MDPAVQFPTTLAENQAGQLPFLTTERKKGGRKSTVLSGLGTILSNLTNRAQRQACPEERERKPPTTTRRRVVFLASRAKGEVCSKGSGTRSSAHNANNMRGNGKGLVSFMWVMYLGKYGRYRLLRGR